MDISRGHKRWKNFQSKIKTLGNHFPILKEGKILDLGCGRGEFVLAGLENGYDVFGIDVQKHYVDTYRKINQKLLEKHCILYDGEHIPFPSNVFSCVYSWFVLEHISNLAEVLRETSRVTQKGGGIILFAQDARTCWEGHANIPWLPFMPKYLIQDWLRIFDKESYLDYIVNHVHYVTTSQVTAILEACDCKIVEQSSTPKSLIPEHTEVESVEDLQKVATSIKQLWEEDSYTMQQHNNITIVAVKN
jgi:ubiquinone/menaquinone biosynthesis C-methylase UbiE